MMEDAENAGNELAEIEAKRAEQLRREQEEVILIDELWHCTSI